MFSRRLGAYFQIVLNQGLSGEMCYGKDFYLVSVQGKYSALWLKGPPLKGAAACKSNFFRNKIIFYTTHKFFSGIEKSVDCYADHC